MINEGAAILDERMAQRSSDIDIVWLNGYGWPAWTGGPMFWANTIGLDKVAASLEAQGMEVAPLLKRKVAEGARL
jgi:3-hydroxyacyl-CoA dehydrogenase